MITQPSTVPSIIGQGGSFKASRDARPVLSQRCCGHAHRIVHEPWLTGEYCAMSGRSPIRCTRDFPIVSSCPVLNVQVNLDPLTRKTTDSPCRVNHPRNTKVSCTTQRIQRPAPCSFLCCSFSLFSIFMNSRMPTGTPSNKSFSPVSSSQFVSDPPLSSSILIAA
jgi:hypothetical protein